MVAKIFQVIGVIAIILVSLVVILVFYFLNKGLRHLNETIGSGRAGIGRELRTSMEGLDDARDQLGQISAATEAARAGMDSAIAAADTVLMFLQSKPFQVGVPVVMWLALLAFTLPRSLARHRKKKREVIPPPSWQAADERLAQIERPGSN